MTDRLSKTERDILTVLARSNSPMRRGDVMKKVGMKKGWSKIVGAFTKENYGIQKGDNLARRGLVAAAQRHPRLLVEITDEGKAVLGLTSTELSLLPEDALLDEPGEDSFVLTDDDQRKAILRQIKERRGQAAFRNALRQRYGDKCLISGCAVLEVLEAAHIKPYRGKQDHKPANGLLLRADLHTLFDLDLIGIEPESLLIHVHSSLCDTFYQILQGTKLRCKAFQPNADAIRLRWDRFQSNCR